MLPPNGPAWSNVPTRLAGDPTLSARAKIAALAVGCHTNSEFMAKVGHAILADTVSSSVPTIKRGLKELERSGWLVIHRDKKSPTENDLNVYEWNFRQAKLSAVRMKRGRAVRPPSNYPTPRVRADPTPRVKPDGGGRVSPDLLTSSSSTIGVFRERDKPDAPFTTPNADFMETFHKLRPEGPRPSPGNLSTSNGAAVDNATEQGRTGNRRGAT